MSPSNNRMNWKMIKACTAASKSKGVQKGWFGERKSSVAFASIMSNAMDWLLVVLVE
jgi:hypothetical protein